MSGLYNLVDLDDIKLHLIQDIEHVILKIGVRLVDFIDEQNGPDIRCKGLANLAHLDIVLYIADIPCRVAESTVIEPCECIVLIECLHKLHARFHIQNNQRHLEALCNRVCQHGFPGAGLPF